MLKVNDTIHGCTVLREEELPEIDGTAYELLHEASGAKLLYLQNEDENKAFSITFPTPPSDDTGVFHILEHSVLCGSDKFPVKEPFVDLLKGSMQTFLNAMTFPDKTMYPVASTNEQDLLNLMDVYLDAVLNPKLYSDRCIFEQEGWHYELEGAEDGEIDAAELEQAHLKYNGVVFNEMKGSLANPDNVLFHELNRQLFPNSCYAFESGGHPRSIPQLTYEGYCDTHARHYRLDNSYIILYGDMDIDRILAFLDNNYLNKPQRVVDAGPNPVGTTEAVQPEDIAVEMDTAPENACVGIGYVIGEAADAQRVLAVEVLLDAIMGGNESPLKRVLLEANLGGDCTAFTLDSQAKPAALFMLKNAKPNVARAFRELVETEVAKLIEEGIPRDVLEASLSQITFSLRERDRDTADGVVLAMNAMAGWLYDDACATTYLKFEEPIAAMRKGLDSGYFEDLLKTLVLESEHSAMVEVIPAKPTEDAEAAELAAAEATLDTQARQGIVDETATLRQRQEAPDTPEALATLPKLHISDIGPSKPDPTMHVRIDKPLACLHHTASARHINYVYAFFDMGAVSFEDLPYATLLGMLLGNLDTEHYTAAELDVYTRSHLGSLRFGPEVQVYDGDPTSVRAKMMVFASALAEEVENLASLTREVWATTRFEDAERIRNVLVQFRIGMEQSFTQAGHSIATMRAHSYLFPSGVLQEQLSGIGLYRFLCELIDNFDNRFAELSAKLDEVRNRIFVKQGTFDGTTPQGVTPLVSFTGTEEELDAFWQAVGDWQLPASEEVFASEAPQADSAQGTTPAGGNLVLPAPVVRNEAFTIPSEVNFNARVAKVDNMDSYDGRWPVLQRVLSYDYLWNEVRVKGGAYGCGFRSTAQGRINFHSYRDPQIDATLQRFDAAAQWLAEFAPETDEWEGYIVSTVAGHDAPAKAKKIARRQAVGYLIGQPSDYREKRRAEYLACTPDTLRELAPALETLSATDAFCTFGNDDTIKAAKAPYKEIIKLLG